MRNVLVDGRISGSSTGEGVIVRELIDSDCEAGYEVRRYDGGDFIDVIVPWDRVKSWRVTCTCGWTGSERPAVTDAKYGFRDCPPEVEHNVFRPEWSAHVEPFEALYDLGKLVEELHTIECRIDDKVLLARSVGTSWAAVGVAAGLTKQGAQQRWGHLLPGRTHIASPSPDGIAPV